MDYRIARQTLVAVALTVLIVGCNKSPTGPTAPGGSGGGGNTATVTSMAISGNLAIAEGATSQLTATATMSSGATQNVSSQATWQSSDTTVATVSGTGLVTALKAGNADISATYGGQTARITVQVSAASYRLTVSGLSVTALNTCDDVTQGLTNGEFAIRIRAITASGGQTTLLSTASYPGSSSNPQTYSLGRNQTRSFSGGRSFTVQGAAGQFLRIQFNATEWDTQVVIIPPSIRNIHDSRMSDRSGTRTHSYSNGSFGSLGPNSITLGNSSCGIRLNYTISAARQ